MANKFTLDNNKTLSLIVSHEDYMVNFKVTMALDGRWGTFLDHDMNLREMMWLLQVTPEMLRSLADEIEQGVDNYEHMLL